MRDQTFEFVQIKGLGQVVKSALLVGVHSDVQIGVGGGDDKGQVGVTAVGLFQQGQAVHVAHADVADDQIGGDVLTQGCKQVAAIRKAARAVAPFVQAVFDDEADGGIVVGYPDGVHGCGSRE